MKYLIILCLLLASCDSWNPNHAAQQKQLEINAVKAKVIQNRYTVIAITELPDWATIWTIKNNETGEEFAVYNHNRGVFQLK